MITRGHSLCLMGRLSYDRFWCRSGCAVKSTARAMSERSLAVDSWGGRDFSRLVVVHERVHGGGVDQWGCNVQHFETQSASDYPGGSGDCPGHCARVALIPVEGNQGKARSIQHRSKPAPGHLHIVSSLHITRTVWCFMVNHLVSYHISYSNPYFHLCPLLPSHTPWIPTSPPPAQSSIPLTNIQYNTCILLITHLIS